MEEIEMIKDEEEVIKIYENSAKYVSDIPNGGKKGQVLGKKSDADKDIGWINQTGGSGEGGGTYDYSQLDNKPQINGIVLDGNKTSEDLGIKQGGSTKPADTQMSDTSENAVQNKVIKKYVDDLANQVGPLLNDKSLGISNAQIGQIIEVEAIDEAGKPTKWKTVDKPAGQKITSYKNPKTISFTNGMQIIMYASGNTDVSMTIGNATITKSIRANVIWGLMLQTSPSSGSFILPSGTRDYMAYGSNMTPTEIKIEQSNKAVSLVINVVGG